MRSNWNENDKFWWLWVKNVNLIGIILLTLESDKLKKIHCNLWSFGVYDKMVNISLTVQEWSIDICSIGLNRWGVASGRVIVQSGLSNINFFDFKYRTQDKHYDGRIQSKIRSYFVVLPDTRFMTVYRRVVYDEIRSYLIVHCRLLRRILLSSYRKLQTETTILLIYSLQTPPIRTIFIHNT